MSCTVFVSYSSIKDMNGAVTKFCLHLEHELRQKTGDVDLSVFQDRRAIHGGDKWQDILESELASANLLLILMSPTWLRREWCRREFALFKASMTPSWRKQVVPLVWDTVGDSDAKTQEEQRLLTELRSYQWLVWDELKYADWASPEPNQAAGRLAKELKTKLAT
jgi:hypothetical protein